MNILMIDDAKNPREFFKDANKTRFTVEEVTLVKTYSEGMEHLLEKGPWDVLLLDWNLNEFAKSRNGFTILNHYAFCVGTSRCPHKVKKIIIITADDEIREQMKDICKILISEGTLDEVEAQYNGKVVKY